MMTKKQIEDILYCISVASNPGHTPEMERRMAVIEAKLRDVLGQDHGVWRWRATHLSS